APDGTLLGEINTGYISETRTPQWKQYALQFRTQPGIPDIILIMRNNSEGGNGNDLAIDDITFRPCGPDLNPEVVEAGSTDTHLCEGATKDLLLTTADVSAIYSSPRYQWQRKLNSDTWENIPNADHKDYTASFIAANE